MHHANKTRCIVSMSGRFAIDTFYTNAEGYLVTPEKLEYGSGYSLVEVQAPYLPSLLCNRKRPSAGHHPLAFRQRGGKAFL